MGSEDYAFAVYDGDGDGGEGKEYRYKVLRESDIGDLQEKDIRQVSSVLSISTAASCTLLHRYRWNATKALEEWLADEQRVREAAGLLQGPVETQGEPSSSTTTCMICSDTYGSDATAAAVCGHGYCGACWRGYIATSIAADGDGCLSLRCPDPSCGAAVGRDMISNLATAQDRDRYSRYLVRSYIDENRRRMKRCPSPGCEFVLVFDLGGGGGGGHVRCTCSYTFSWNSAEEEDQPCPKCGRLTENQRILRRVLLDLQLLRDGKLKPLGREVRMADPRIRSIVINAWTQMVECRRVLQWTHAYWCRLTERERAKREFLGFLLAQGESLVDRLHRCAEEGLTEHLITDPKTRGSEDFHGNLAGLACATRTYFNDLARAVETELEDVCAPLGADGDCRRRRRLRRIQHEGRLETCDCRSNSKRRFFFGVF